MVGLLPTNLQVHQFPLIHTKRITTV